VNSLLELHLVAFGGAAANAGMGAYWWALGRKRKRLIAQYERAIAFREVHPQAEVVLDHLFSLGMSHVSAANGRELADLLRRMCRQPDVLLAEAMIGAATFARAIDIAHDLCGADDKDEKFRLLAEALTAAGVELNTLGYELRRR
jgi:hypothetical protein